MTVDLSSVPRQEISSRVAAIARPRGRFYVFEGIDGSGKTTVSRMLFERIPHDSRAGVILTAEPTTNWLGDQVRRCFKEDVSTVTETLLFMADRAAHTERIRRWLSDGIIVLCDRYNASTLAYQGSILRKEVGEEALEWLKQVSQFLIIQPDITFLFSIDPESALKRLDGRDEKTKFERLSFLTQVDQVYCELVEEDPGIMVIDASKPLKEVMEEVLNAIKADL